MKSNNNIRIKHRQKGFILVLTLFVAVILATLIIAFFNVAAVDLNLAKNYMCSSQAYYIAEAGIADAINQLRLNGPLADTQWQQSFPAGSADTYNVSVSQSSTIINATGIDSESNFTRALEVEVSVSGTSSPYSVSITKWKELTQ